MSEGVAERQPWLQLTRPSPADSPLRFIHNLSSRCWPHWEELTRDVTRVDLPLPDRHAFTQWVLRKCYDNYWLGREKEAMPLFETVPLFPHPPPPLPPLWEDRRVLSSRHSSLSAYDFISQSQRSWPDPFLSHPARVLGIRQRVGLRTTTKMEPPNLSMLCMLCMLCSNHSLRSQSKHAMHAVHLAPRLYWFYWFFWFFWFFWFCWFCWFCWFFCLFCFFCFFCFFWFFWFFYFFGLVFWFFVFFFGFFGFLFFFLFFCFFVFFWFVCFFLFFWFFGFFGFLGFFVGFIGNGFFGFFGFLGFFVGFIGNVHSHNGPFCNLIH